eukprot:TRINITY_DN8480_c0_g1::TRINITY_DN8480_c0_g1_i1::g.3467::m.3467 TRINITY_DN8480_c0_g1::TRINITY_DN8480_c0_g1_i1::g.3467  ORF type:complete len:538 (-),score=81.84,sp/Q3MHE2/PRP4_BOVIN/43.90/1e-123,sp/Q3MHE2/PRP4_BOVIN/25.20/9e-06,WD40/PF00400.27/0.012,WD40/PF00400.27/2.6e-05,WD40/PF00400.27/8.1e-09,WD40/PF00400.27/5.2e-06,WD40/PF00400.27/8.8e-12,WD40/PF00400.27/5.5e-07,WD40/PF00400.27/3.2e-06,PRP4/PF08799.6/2e-11,eIF2A/PF08662.6/0.12,eIF2A/PF08662.6/1.1e+03,eIF2A/PF08662.6/5.4e+02,eIF2A/PF08662.6/1e
MGARFTNPDAEAVFFNQSGLEAKMRHDDMMREFELKKKARHIAVPTLDDEVKLMLRALDEPVCLFGEDPGLRRDRLRQLLAEGRGENLQKKEDTTGKPVEAPREIFYTEGTEQLREARLFIAKYSLPRARTRLILGKRRYDEETGISHGERSKQEVNRWLFRMQKTCREAAKFDLSVSQVGDSRPIAACTLAPACDMVATASWSGGVRVWNLPDCKSKIDFQGHEDRAVSVAFHPSATADSTSVAVASGGVDNVVKLWSLNDTSPRSVLKGHMHRIGQVAFHPSGRFLTSSSYDCTWRLWDVETSQELLMQEGHSEPVYCLSHQVDGSLLVTGGLDCGARVWDLRTGKSIITLKGHVGQILGVDFHPNGFQLATGSDDNTVRIWDLRKKKCSYTLLAHSNLIHTVRFQPGDTSTLFLTASYDHTAKIWDSRDWTLVHTLQGHEGRVMSADISASADRVVTTGFDKTWKLWTLDGNNI